MSNFINDTYRTHEQSKAKRNRKNLKASIISALTSICIGYIFAWKNAFSYLHFECENLFRTYCCNVARYMHIRHFHVFRWRIFMVFTTKNSLFREIDFCGILFQAIINSFISKTWFFTIANLRQVRSNCVFGKSRKFKSIREATFLSLSVQFWSEIRLVAFQMSSVPSDSE